MNLLVTGATGQIGGALVRAAAGASHRVRALVRSESDVPRIEALGLHAPGSVEVYRGDLLDAPAVRGAVDGVEGVFHVAGVVSYRRRDVALMQRVHVDGTRALLDAAADADVRRLVATSTIGTLGSVEKGEVGDETTPFNWVGAGIGYFETKLAAERLVLAERRLETVAVNPGIVYGAEDRNLNAVRTVARLAEGRVPGYTDGITTCAVLDDVIGGHLAAMDSGRAGERYILGGTILGFRELFERIARVIDAVPPQRRLSRPFLAVVAAVQEAVAAITGQEPLLTRALVEITTRRRAYTSEKAETELGYRTSPIEEGIQACWDWYREMGRQ